MLEQIKLQMESENHVMLNDMEAKLKAFNLIYFLFTHYKKYHLLYLNYNKDTHKNKFAAKKI